MLDFPHLPNAANGAEIFRFEGSGDWRSFILPRGKSHVGVLCIGSGAGGGAGFGAAAATARGGGGGGGSGAIARAIFQREALPDQLFINTALGGLPGLGGALSRVAIRPDTIIQNSILVSGAAAATAGGVGSAAAVGAAGAASTVSTTITSGAFSSWALSFLAIAGAVGGVGGAVAGGGGSAINWGSSSGVPITGGCGGAGTTSADFAGGNIIAGGWMPGLAGGLAGSNRGQDGIFFSTPLASLGGTGGGSSNTGTGGAGGDGAMGSGGGGGGAGVTGGLGGKGGPGLVIISCW